MSAAGPAPETREPRFLWLLFGCCAAPLCWLGQVMVNYGVTAATCYPADHPAHPASHAMLAAALIACDGVALAGCAAGALVSWHYRRQVRQPRNRMLALWGLMSSLWFFVAILFNIIASFVPPCSS